jgi:hypothetical protein
MAGIEPWACGLPCSSSVGPWPWGVPSGRDAQGENVGLMGRGVNVGGGGKGFGGGVFAVMEEKRSSWTYCFPRMRYNQTTTRKVPCDQPSASA